MSPKRVRAAVGASVLVTAAHYTDNYLFIDEYPAPHWVNREIIYIAWGLLTLVGIAGYIFYRDGRLWQAGVYLAIYSYTGISSLFHYAYGPLDTFSIKMHVFVWADGIVGFVVLASALVVLRDALTGSRFDVSPR